MSFPWFQRRQPPQDLAFVVRHPYLAVSPYIIKTALHIANVFVDVKDRVLRSCSAHLVLHIALLAVGAARRSKAGATRGGGIVLFFEKAGRR